MLSVGDCGVVSDDVRRSRRPRQQRMLRHKIFDQYLGNEAIGVIGWGAK